MKDWITSSGVKDAKAKKINEDETGDEKIFKTTSVKVKKAKKGKVVVKDDKD